MCTYVTEKVAIEGSGKGPDGWFALTHATAYVDHPVHAPFGHTVNIDFLAPERGPSARVAVELTEEDALRAGRGDHPGAGRGAAGDRVAGRSEHREPDVLRDVRLASEWSYFLPKTDFAASLTFSPACLTEPDAWSARPSASSSGSSVASPRAFLGLALPLLGLVFDLVVEAHGTLPFTYGHQWGAPIRRASTIAQ